MEFNTNYALMSIAGFIGATLLGEATNWEEAIGHRKEGHVIYEYDEDEDERFDREIEEALGGTD